MTLYKRGNVYWAYWYMDGVRHQHSTGTANRRIAEQIEQKLKDEVTLSRFQIVRADPNMTFSDLTARFIANGKPTAFHLKEINQLSPFFADWPIIRINKQLARQYREYRHSHKSLSEATINRALACLRRMLNWAVDESLLVTNPLNRLHLEREPRIQRSVISVTDEDRLIDFAPLHIGRMILACRYTGMRRGEVLAQLWEHIDFARRVLYVSKSKTYKGQYRELPIAGPLYDELLPIRRSNGPVFTYDGCSVNEIKTGWRNICTDVLGHRIRFHDLRHAFNTRLVECNIVADVRRELMGHSTGRDVNAVYTHIDLGLKRRAVEALERWIETQRKEETKLAQQSTNQLRGGDTAADVPDSTK